MEFSKGPIKINLAYTHTLMHEERKNQKKFVFQNGRFAPQKPQTESVKRRNARERYRVRGINRSFEKLRACLPTSAIKWIEQNMNPEQTCSEGHQGEACQNNTNASGRCRINKSRLLRYASAYIAHLSALLKENNDLDGPIHFPQESTAILKEENFYQSECSSTPQTVPTGFNSILFTENNNFSCPSTGSNEEFNHHGFLQHHQPDTMNSLYRNYYRLPEEDFFDFHSNPPSSYPYSNINEHAY